MERPVSDAWQALRSTPRKLDRSRYRDIPGRMPAKQPCRTGLSPREAEARLEAAGATPGEARRRVELAVRAHAEDVVRSWGQWVERHGFLDELASLAPRDREELLSRERWDDLKRQVAILTADPVRAAVEKGLLSDLLERAGRYNRHDPSHPSVFVLQRLHGLPAGLAEASALHAAGVPAWALAAVATLTVLSALVCVAAFAAILQGRLDAVARFLATAVFAAFFGFSFVFLLRARPRREKAWRDRVAAWRAGESEEAGADPSSREPS